MEPEYPAAVDRYVDLGRFYDLTAAKAEAEAVKRHTREYQEAYRRAYRCLKAARQVELESVAAAGRTFDAERLRGRLPGICRRELRQRGNEPGRTVRRFLGSLTHRGYVWRFDSVDALCPRVYELRDSWELAGESLELLRREAVARGWDSIACVSPEEPERMEHLLIPGLGLAFVTSRPEMEYGGTPVRRIRLDALTEPGDRGALRLRRRMTAALREEGVAALSAAKAAHDRLEAVYNPYVDFDGVRTLAALEAGRLLSWLG